jgi:hypothetical protein
MQSTLQIFNKKIGLLLSSPKCQFLIRLMLMTFLMVLWRQAFADDDPFKGTEGGLVASMSSGGTIRKFIWLVEGIAGTTILIASRNLIKAFMGVAAIETLLRLVFKLAGI